MSTKTKLFTTLAVISLCTAIFAQSNTGSLSGVVNDPNGAIVPGAKIVVQHDNTGIESETTASEVGSYSFPALPVGPYTVVVSHAGFKKLARTGLVIAIATRSSLDLSLEVGDVQQSVQVTGEAPLLNAASSDLGTSFQPKFMTDAPLFVSGGFRNPENFISFMPGVNGGAQESSINGGSRRSKEVLIDGASHTNPESGGVSFASNGGVGSVEMFGEFKLLTSNFSAEYGRSGGGIEVFVTRSGTNGFHGNGFDFLRNDKLDAAGWAVNQRRPFLGKSKIRQNEYGLSAGGPVYIPKVYNGRNRTFWYFTWNSYRQNNSSGTGIGSVPTPLMKQGDFSELGAKLIYDPATTQTVDGVLVRTPFPNNRIPSNRFSSVSKNMLGLIPDPTGPGISSNYSTSSLATVDKSVYSIKGDHAFSDRNRLSGFYSWQRLSSVSQSGLPGALATGSENIDKPDTTRANHDLVLRPNLINHATFGLSRYQALFYQLPAQRADWPTKLGLKGVATGDSSSFPIVNFGDGLTKFGNEPKTRGAQQNWTWTASDALTWIHGRHEFKFGFEYRKGRTFQVPLDESYSQGMFQFLNFQTAAPGALRATTGYSFASFLLGGPDNSRRDYYTSGVDNIYGYRSAFVQDNFKVSSRLTLNLGVRYEVFIPRTDNNLTLSAFDPNIPNPGANGLKGALSFAGEGPGRNGQKRFGDIYYNNFGPRIGVAYQLSSKTVLRGGYGMYFSGANGNTGGGCFPCGWGVGASPTPTSLDGLSPVFNWDGGFQPPAGFKLPPVLDPAYANGQTVLVLSKEDGLAGRIQNWSLNIQRTLPKNFLVDVSYIGSKSTRLNNYVPYNQVDPKYLYLGANLSKSITDPSVVALGFTKPYPTFTGTLAQSLRPYPQYNNIIHTYLGKGANSYQAFQAKVEKRYSSVSLLFGYTLSKTIAINGAFTQTGNGVAPQNQYDTESEKALALHDVPHVVNAIYSWDLPFGRGKRFLNSSKSVVTRIVGGWTLAGIHNYRSGTLLSIAPANTLGAGVLFTAALRANLTGSPIRSGATRTNLDPADPNVRWFNRDAFSIPGQYQFGNAGAYLNELRAPMFLTENLSIIKRMLIKESMNLEFRADVSNLFNRTCFGGINVSLTDPNFGRPTAVQNGPRLIQMGLKFNF